MIPLRPMLVQHCAGHWRGFSRLQPTNYWKSDIESSAGWVFSPKAKPPRPRLALDLMFGTWGKLTGVWWLSAVALIGAASAGAAEPEFRFDRDTFAFQNATVLKYHDGIAFFRPKSEADDPANNYT